jgi:hypothetical protein
MSDIPRPASRSTIRRTDVAAIVLLAVLVLLFMWRVTLLGKVLLPLDALFPMEPWKSETTHPADAVWNPIVTDAVWQWAPLASAARELQGSGSYLWDPLSMGGVPSFVAGAISINPLVFILGHFLSVAAAMSWAAVISLVLGATFAYLLLRELDCAPWASLIGALAFTFNGYLVGWLSVPNMTGGMIWLPAIAWGIERSINARDWRWSLVSAGAVALQLLTSSILFSFYGAVTIGILLSCRCIAAVIRERNVTQALPPLRYGALAFAVGAGIAAIPLFTTLQLYYQTDRTSLAGARSVLAFSTHFIRLLAPTLYGNSLHGNAYQSSFNYVETNLYFGVLPAFFILAGLFSPRRALTWPLFALGAAALLAVYDIPPFRPVMARIYPVFLNAFPGRIFYVVVFCWSLLAGLGADWLARCSPRRPLRGLAVAALASAAILLGLAIAAANARHPPRQEALQILYYQLRSFSLASLFVAAGLAAIAAAIFWVWSYRGRLARYAQAAALVCLVADLFAAGMNFNPALDESLVFPDTPSLQRLRELQSGNVGTARIATVPSHSILYGMSPEQYGLQSVSGYSSFALTRYARYIHLTQPFTTINHIFLTECCSPLLDALNARYIYTPAGVQLQNADALRLIYDGGVKIYENASALPRAWIVHRIATAAADDLDGVGERLRAANFRPAAEAVVETERTLPEIADADAVQSHADIRSYEPQTVVVDAELPHAGLLVLSDTMYPGWQAYVDDRPAPIYYTNLFMRGVFLEPGAHRVRFVYRPRVLWLGAAVSVATLVVVIGALVIHRRRPI